MTPQYTGFLGVLYDWQTCLAGLLALAAGLLAYCVGKQQKAATERQTRHFQRETKRQLAREGIIAARLISGILQGLKDDIHSLQGIWVPRSGESVPLTVIFWFGPPQGGPQLA